MAGHAGGNPRGLCPLSPVFGPGFVPSPEGPVNFNSMDLTRPPPSSFKEPAVLASSNKSESPTTTPLLRPQGPIRHGPPNFNTYGVQRCVSAVNRPRNLPPSHNAGRPFKLMGLSPRPPFPPPVELLQARSQGSEHFNPKNPRWVSHISDAEHIHSSSPRCQNPIDFTRPPPPLPLCSIPPGPPLPPPPQNGAVGNMGHRNSPIPRHRSPSNHGPQSFDLFKGPRCPPPLVLSQRSSFDTTGPVNSQESRLGTPSCHRPGPFNSEMGTRVPSSPSPSENNSLDVIRPVNFKGPRHETPPNQGSRFFKSFPRSTGSPSSPCAPYPSPLQPERVNSVMPPNGSGGLGPPQFGPPNTIGSYQTHAPPKSYRWHERNRGSSGPETGPYYHGHQSKERPPCKWTYGNKRPNPWTNSETLQQCSSKKKRKNKDKQCHLESNQFVCETCDRAFKTEEKYKTHIDSHEKCRYKECSYEAAPKLVQLHILWQHKTGFAKKIWQLESKEDIKKWIAERKKNFPTSENIAKKEALQTKKQARGDVLENKYFGKMRGGGRGSGGWNARGRGRGRGAWRNDYYTKNDTEEDLNQIKAGNQVEELCKPSRENCKEKSEEKSGAAAEVNTPSELKGDPLALVLSNTDSSEECPEDLSTVNSMTKNDSPVVLRGALGSLALMYADCSDSEDDEATETQSKVERDPSSGNKPVVVEIVAQEKPRAGNSAEVTVGAPVDSAPVRDQEKGEELNDPSPPEEHKSDMFPGQASRPFRPYRRERRRKQKQKELNNNRSQQFKGSKHIPSLLEKLLANDIRHERNVILQCVKFIVKKKFFGVGQTGTSDKDINGNMPVITDKTPKNTVAKLSTATTEKEWEKTL